MPFVRCVELGRQPYHETLALQRALRLCRLDGSLPDDLLLFVEHPPVYTLGRSTRATSLPVTIDALRVRGADVVDVERGGDVTWHGPGQLVGYPVVHLSQHREDLHWYLRTLEATLVDALAEFSIPAHTQHGHTGVWTDGRKIASIGIHVKQWVTLHGFALNVDPDLSWFEPIVPCGIHGVTMTSIAAELGDTRPSAARRADAIAAVAAAFAVHFAREPVVTLPAELPSTIETFASAVLGNAERRALAHLP